MLNPLESTIYRLRNARILNYPFPHAFVEDVFPTDFYWELVASLSGQTYAPLQGGYKARVASATMPECMEPFNSPDGQHRFSTQMMALFVKQFYERFPSTGRPEFKSEWRFIRDSEGYAIGPHTDAPQKVLSMLFYLQAVCEDADAAGNTFFSGQHTTEYGTGVYVPVDGVKTCIGGPHHKFSGFKEVWRAPFLRNSCFFFWKTANSWHAVEEIREKIQRDVLLFNIYEGK